MVPATIRWYFTSNKARPLPFRHQYASSNWTRPTAYNEQVGEILSVSRPYNKGAFPLGLIVGGYCGNEDIWRGKLDRLTTPMPLNVFDQPACCGDPVAWILQGIAGEDDTRKATGTGELLLTGEAGEDDPREAVGTGPWFLTGEAGEDDTRIDDGTGHLIWTGHASGSGSGSGSGGGGTTSMQCCADGVVNNTIYCSFYGHTGTGCLNVVTVVMHWIPGTTTWESDPLPNLCPGSGSATGGVFHLECPAGNVGPYGWRFKVLHSSGCFVDDVEYFPGSANCGTWYVQVGHVLVGPACGGGEVQLMITN